MNSKAQFGLYSKTLGLYLILLLITFCSCQKEKSLRWTETDITITNLLTGDPIQGLSVSLLELKPKLLKSEYAEYKSITDENGLAEIDFKRLRNATHSIAIKVNDEYGPMFYQYLTDTLIYNPKQWKNMVLENENEFHVQVVINGYLKLTTTNDSCDSNSYYDAWLTYLEDYDIDHHHSLGRKTECELKDAEFDYPLFPGKYEFNCIMYKPGKQDSLITTTVDIQEGDTLIYELPF